MNERKMERVILLKFKAGLRRCAVLSLCCAVSAACLQWLQWIWSRFSSGWFAVHADRAQAPMSPMAPMAQASDGLNSLPTSVLPRPETVLLFMAKGSFPRCARVAPVRSLSSPSPVDIPASSPSLFAAPLHNPPPNGPAHRFGWRISRIKTSFHLYIYLSIYDICMYVLRS